MTCLFAQVAYCRSHTLLIKRMTSHGGGSSNDSERLLVKAQIRAIGCEYYEGDVNGV